MWWIDCICLKDYTDSSMGYGEWTRVEVGNPIKEYFSSQRGRWGEIYWDYGGYGYREINLRDWGWFEVKFQGKFLFFVVFCFKLVSFSSLGAQNTHDSISPFSQGSSHYLIIAIML